MALITAPIGVRYAISVTNTLTAIRTLVLAAGMPAGIWPLDVKPGAFGLRIAGQVVAGTDRAAMIIASPRYVGTPLTFAALTATDASTHGEYIPAGQEYYNPMDADIYSGLVTASGSATCNITVYIRST